MFDTWMSDAMREPAKSVINAPTPLIQDLENFIKTPYTRRHVQSKTFQGMRDARKLKCKEKT